MPKDPNSEPLSLLRWVPVSYLRRNEYNPNHVAPPELELLKLSILEDGWTQPIVVFERSETELVIVDGEHRSGVAADETIAARTGGLVPVVPIRGKTEADLMIATVRHNRARGEHGVIPMANIVGELLKVMSPEEVERRLQMEDEEVNRLAEKDGMPIQASRGKAGFNTGWVPGHE